MAGHGGIPLYSQHLKGTGRKIFDFEASGVSIMSSRKEYIVSKINKYCYKIITILKYDLNML